MISIDFAGQRLALYSDGTLFWPQERILVAADLNFDEPCGFGLLLAHGRMDTIDRLRRAAEETGAMRIVVLGPCGTADAPLRDSELDALDDLCDRHPLICVQEDTHADGGLPGRAQSCSVLTLSGLVFRHYPSPGGEREINGGLRPVFASDAAPGLDPERCFARDPRRIVLPAFGPGEGGSLLDGPEMSALMASESTTIYTLSGEKVRARPHERRAA